MSERLNIKNMLVESAKEPEYHFNPEHDITSEQREEMAKVRATYATKKQWTRFCQYIGHEKILGSNIDITPEQKQAILAEKAPLDVDSELAVAVDKKIVGIDVVLSPNFQQKINEKKDRYAQRKMWHQFAVLVRDQKIFGMPVSLSSDELAAIENLKGKYYEGKDLDAFALIATIQKELGIPISIPAEVRVEMAEKRKLLASQGEWDRFGLFACRQAILSADEVIIPEDGGLKLVFKDRKEDKDSTSPLPNQRNF